MNFLKEADRMCRQYQRPRGEPEDSICETKFSNSITTEISRSTDGFFPNSMLQNADEANGNI